MAAAPVRTRGGLLLANAGEKGRAVVGATPSSSTNWGRVLVLWRDQAHAYWCRQADLTAPDGLLDSCVARKPERASAIKLPSAGAYRYHFGENLRMIRQARRVSQMELGARMAAQGFSVRQSTVSHWERSRACPSGEFVDSAARALRVAPYAFFLPLDDCKSLLRTGDSLRVLSSALCRS
jgi:hypothetical protein